MASNDVWEEIHLIPVRLQFHREGVGTVVCRLPEPLPSTVAIRAHNRDDALASLIEQMYLHASEPE